MLVVLVVSVSYSLSYINSLAGGGVIHAKPFHVLPICTLLYDHNVMDISLLKKKDQGLGAGPTW